MSNWTRFFGGPQTSVILQTEAAECGLACLAMVAGYHGLDTDLHTLRSRWSVSLKGTTLANMMAFAEELKLAPRALRLEMQDLGQLRCPSIAHWNLDHFVVVERVRRRSISIIDPAFGHRALTPGEFAESFTGIALELVPASGFEPRDDTSKLSLGAFFAGASGLTTALVRILGLSLALQVFVLVAPLFSQLVIDEVVVTGDTDLLTVVGVAFLLLALLQVCVGAVRRWCVTLLGASLQMSWSARLFHHMLRLPLSWFERRHVGDVASRFGSLRAVEALVTETVVAALMDGLMALTTLAVMLFYSTELTAVVVVAVLVYALARAMLLPSMRRVGYEALMLGAREQSTFMESVRAVLPLKNFGREALREAMWQNRKAEAINAEVRSSRLRLIQQLVNGIVFAAENVAVLWIGALVVLGGGMSIGMLVAFVAYKNQFSGRTAALIDRIVQYRLVGVHLDRIADIALTTRDVTSASETNPAFKVHGAITARGLEFRYATSEPFVVSGLDLDIAAGECVAITAPSGAGKSTVLKLMMGLLRPTSGLMIVDGVELRNELLPAWRRQVAAVMQDDSLLSGTLADNVCCFDPQPERARIEECARLAAIDQDIRRMPMGWFTLVGDMGSALSGGQRQRLLLARALYTQPRVLFLDEATSHLDTATEARIHEALGRMDITRVMITHRQETLQIADRVIELPAVA